MHATNTGYAPRHLSKDARILWRRLAEDYGLHDEPHAVKLLTLMCEASDRGEQARQALAQHGTTYVDRFGAPRPRPEVAIERDSRLAVARLLRELSLDGETGDTRIPRVGSGALA